MPYIEYNKYNTLPEQVEENRINIQNAVNTADNALAIVEENKRVVEENNSVVNSYTNKVDTNTADISQLKQKDIAIEQSIENTNNRITESNGRITQTQLDLSEVASDVALLKLEQINIRGQWITHDNYNKNDFAYYNNSLFNCIKQITNSTTPPPDDLEHWEYVLLVTTSGGGTTDNGVTALQTNTEKINGTLGSPNYIWLDKNYNDSELNYTTRKKCDMYLKYVDNENGINAGMVCTINLVFNSENSSQSIATIPIIKSSDFSVINTTYLIDFAKSSSNDYLQFGFTAIGSSSIQDSEILGGGITFEKAVFY